MISHKYKCIFVHVMKTGGTTLEKMFEQNGEIVNCGNEKHLTAFEAKKAYEKFWDQYFRFTIVRNPWDLLYSYWFNGNFLHEVLGVTKEARKKMKNKDLTGKINGMLDRGKKCFHSYVVDLRGFKDEEVFRQQSKFLGINGQILFDYIGRFEKINDTYKYFIDKYQFSNTTIPHMNQIAGKPSYIDFYDEKLIKIVGNIFARDVERWNYTFDNK